MVEFAALRCIATGVRIAVQVPVECRNLALAAGQTKEFAGLGRKCFDIPHRGDGVVLKTQTHVLGKLNRDIAGIDADNSSAKVAHQIRCSRFDHHDIVDHVGGDNVKAESLAITFCTGQRCAIEVTGIVPVVHAADIGELSFHNGGTGNPLQCVGRGADVHLLHVFNAQHFDHLRSDALGLNGPGGSCRLWFGFYTDTHPIHRLGSGHQYILIDLLALYRLYTVAFFLKILERKNNYVFSGRKLKPVTAFQIGFRLKFRSLGFHRHRGKIAAIARLHDAGDDTLCMQHARDDKQQQECEKVFHF